MSWWQRFKVWVINLFAQEAPTPLPPPIIEPEIEEEEIVVPPIAIVPSIPLGPDYSFTPDEYVDHYKNLWETMEIRDDKKSTIAWYMNRVSDSAIERYKKVSEISGVPWEVIAVIHLLESSGSFEGVLHNGDEIIGTGDKTYRVPKGRGPFDTWEEAAVDALSIKESPSEWNIVNTLHYLEKFNGLGYLNDPKKPNSPYLWSFSKHYFRGKYTHDHGYSSTAVSKQIGAAVALSKLKYLS